MITQEEECLPSMHEALSSNPYITKEKTKMKKIVVKRQLTNCEKIITANHLTEN
jgi:hypothetical protein